jgi:Reverse transcriptase (RNA-dependent DNA polymerase)
MDNLNHAVEASNEAVKATPSDHPDRASQLSNLGILLGRRFEQTGAINDLNLNHPTRRWAREEVSALSQLVDVVQYTAWAHDPKCIVSMLSLDLSGAFDKVSHARLLWIFRKKRLPEWTIGFVQGFLVDRKTQLTFSGFTSDIITTQTGIPQGSPLSSVLFLLFPATLRSGGPAHNNLWMQGLTLGGRREKKTSVRW